jgi:hypothetical protein
MGARIVIKTLTPLPSYAKGRVTAQQRKDWTQTEVEIRTCLHCRTAYAKAGFAWRCEHHHEGLYPARPLSRRQGKPAIN